MTTGRIWILALTAAGACSSSDATAPDRPITAVTVTPGSATLVLGQTLKLTAAITGGFGASTIAWTSSNTAVATVDSTGTLTTKSAGTTTITATPSNGSVTGTAAITVTTGAVDRVSACDRGQTGTCSDHATLGGLGSSVVVRATAYNSANTDITSSCVFSWTPNVANVVSIALSSDATKRDAVITRTGYGVISVIVSCNGIPAAFTIEGPLTAP